MAANLIFDIIARDRASEELDRVREHTGKLKDGILTAGKYAAIGFGGLVAGAGLAAGAFGYLGVKTASSMEQAQIAFTTMLGSAQKATAFLSDLQKFAAATPFEFGDLTQMSQELLAMGFNAKSVVPTLTAIGDAVAGLGGGKDKIQEVTLAIGQMQAKGKIQSDELMQLTEAGIPALKILADKYHVTTAEMQDMVTKGKVLSDDALPKLVDGLEHGTKSTAGFGGMMDKQSHTMAGLWSTLQDTVSMAAANAMKPLLPIAEKLLPKLIDLAGKFGAQFTEALAKIGPKVKSIALSVGDFFVKMKDPAVHALEGLGQAGLKAFKLIFSTAKAVLPDILKILGGIAITGAKVFGPLVGAALELLQKMKPLLDVLAKFFGWLSSGSKYAGLLRAALTGIVAAFVLFAVVGKVVAAVQLAINLAMALNPIFLVVIAIGALVGALIYAYGHFKTFHNIINGVFSWIKNNWPYLTTIILGPFAPIAAGLIYAYRHFEGFRNVVNETVTWISDHWKLLVGILLLPVAAVVVLVAAVTTHFGEIKGAVGDAVHWIGSKLGELSSLPGKVGGYFWSIKTAIDEKISAILGVVAAMPGQIADKLAALASKGYNAGKSLVEGIGKGITEWIKVPYDALKSGLGKLAGLIPHSPAKEGPFSGRGWTLYGGMAISEALGAGISAGAGKAMGSARALMGSLHGELSAGSFTASTALQGQALAGSAGLAGSRSGQGGGDTYHIHIPGLIAGDPNAVARAVVQILQQHVRTTKQPLQVKTI